MAAPKKKLGVVLVNMDGTLMDLDQGLATKLKERGHAHWSVSVTNRSKVEYDDQMLPVIKEIMIEPGFFVSLAPLLGAVSAMKGLQAEGWEVYICTNISTDDLKYYEHCLLEKYKWIEIHFGKEWIHRITVTSDKTLLRGDYLIDDRPTHTGLAKPTWYPILYDRSYNRQFLTPRIRSWIHQEDIGLVLQSLHQH